MFDVIRTILTSYSRFTVQADSTEEKRSSLRGRLSSVSVGLRTREASVIKRHRFNSGGLTHLRNRYCIQFLDEFPKFE